MTQRPSDPSDLALWSAVDRYFEEALDPGDAALRSALSESRTEHLPEIEVSRLQGRWLELLARVMGARRILEIGTLGGYSTIWLARALPPEGRLVTLELDPRHAELARKNLARAGLEARVEVLIGDASESLRELVRRNVPPFDLVFLDADKEGYPGYYELALKLVRPGALIVADNVVRRGDVAEAESSDPQVQGVRHLIDRVSGDPRIVATVVQTVGRKGHDGMLLAFVRA
ncbi:MAG TPA: O-methyltransferase [Thermoplasmata archaeon]|nr:O-methyltransferase [Thermoplasmata archaeon]